MSRAVWLDKTRAEARENVIRWLANHRVVEEGEGRWYFGREGSGIHHMRVIRAPCCLFVYGDCGTIAWTLGGRDMFTWVGSVIREDGYDAAYLYEKLASGLSFKDFDQRLVSRYVKGLLDEAHELEEEWDEKDSAAAHRNIAAQIRGFGEFGSAAEFYTFLHNLDFDIDEYPQVEAISYQFFFLVEGLRLFYKRLPEAETAL